MSRGLGDVYKRQMLIIIGTFIANLFFDTNIMVLILIDGIIGLLFMRAAQYN